MAPHSPAGELCEGLLTKIAGARVREAALGGPRMDVVSYMLAALVKLGELGVEGYQPIAFEIAMLGSKGLDINDAEKKYTLKTMPGEFSGLELVSYMYVGFEQIAPGTDQGIDLRREYEMAKGVSGGRPG
ncbi:MAG: hypothetical protein HY900_20640 [Deltaproteobacteria bacterium]|nr:hypothetical protein [Deltaproteobacteria bacterium]